MTDTLPAEEIQRLTGEKPATGWPAPALAQDECRKLFGWFASKLDSRRRVREALEEFRE